MRKTIVALLAVGAVLGLGFAARRVSRKMRAHVSEMAAHCKQMAAQAPARAAQPEEPSEPVGTI